MSLSLEEMLATRPMDLELVETQKREMLAETWSYWLRELREPVGRTRPDAHPDSTT